MCDHAMSRTPKSPPNEGHVTGDAEDAARVVVPPAETTIESVGTRREDEPVNRPSAPADEALAQVAERFGADAARDVAEVIASDRRATTDVARVALERLLAVEPARLERSAGAYFRRLVELASDARLAPLSRRPPRCAAEPREDDVKAQIARVNALKDELQRADLSIEQHRQLTHALHQETDALIRLRAAKNARDQTKVVSRMAPLATPPPPPPRPRAGPLPDWLATFIHEQLGDAGATSTDSAATP